MENRKVTVTTNLTKFALSMGYSIETDPYQDCSHSGYSAQQVREMNLRLSPELSNIHLIFPSAVAQALEATERDAWAAASREFRLKALKKSLLEINLKNIHYTDVNKKSINSEGAILDVIISEVNDEITLEILNPEHLINAIVDGVGIMTEPLSSTEEESIERIEAQLHNLAKAAEVYGLRVYSGEVPSQYSPSSDDDFFYGEIKQVISEYDLDRVCEEIRDSAEHGFLELKDLVNVGSTYTKFNPEEIRLHIKNYYLNLSKKWS